MVTSGTATVGRNRSSPLTAERTVWPPLDRSFTARPKIAIRGQGQVGVFILTNGHGERHLVLADQVGRPSALPPREDSPHRVCKPLVAGTQTRRRGASSRPAGRGAASPAGPRGQRRRAATGTRVRTITRSGSSLVPRNDATASSNARGVRSRRGAGAVGRSTTAPRANSGSAMDERGRIRIGCMGDGPTWQADASACLPYRRAGDRAYGRSVTST